MSNPGHTRPGALRPGLTYLPDGRARMVVAQKLSSGEQIRNDLLLTWGTLYSEAERVDCTGRNSALAGLRLVGGQEVQPASDGNGWVWLRIYEDIPASAEVQVGKLRTVLDENGRTVARAEFIQLASATATPGTVGTTAAPGASTQILSREEATDDGALRRITRDYTQATATLTQIGPEQITTDEDGRKAVEARFIILRSASYTPGVVDTTTAPTTTSCVLAREIEGGNAAVRLVTRLYNQTTAVASTAEAVGPVVLSYPFSHLGDSAHVVASQVYEQPSTHYAPLTLNATRVVTVGGSSTTLYYVGDITPPGRHGAGLLRFTRQWANKPATRTENQTYAVTFPGIASTLAEYEAKTANKTRAREGFTEIVDTQLTYTYYRIAASGGDYTSDTLIPRDTVQRYYVPTWGADPKSPFDTYLNNGENYGTFYWRPTTPTRTAYNALGTWGLVVECEVKRYLGPFFVRITRRTTPL